MTKPNCFGKQPALTSHLYAEYDCRTCVFNGECDDVTLAKTPAPNGVNAQIADELVTLANKGPFAGYPKGENLGFKQDQGKLRWSLLPKGVISSIIKVLEFGAAKYAVDNWRHVEDHERRYYDAAMRHIEAWRLKETNDPESKLPHLAHAVCCLMFLMWFDGRSNG